MAPAPVFLEHPSSLAHDTGSHPEQAARIPAIGNALAQRDWLGFKRVRSPEVERETLYAVHPERYVEATIHEGMRIRPVIPMIARLVTRPWRLGEYVVPARTPVAISIVALHHRDDVYPNPDVFRPERFLDQKPGTYTWIPFGGGIRRCLGASLAMAEQRVVLGAIARRADLTVSDTAPEAPRQRNVTMIPARGARVILEHRHPAATLSPG